MTLSDEMVGAIEMELRQQVERIGLQPGMEELKSMMTYHLGWEGKDSGPENRGKRIRPLLVTLCAAANRGDWSCALPAAASVELIHNFSLMHDDIEDNSPMRRGRPTIWKIWGISQAINTGDAMFALAQLSIFDLDTRLPPERILESSRLLHLACLELTQGQFLDITYENRADLSLELYWQMISGKTAILIACSCEIGALLGGAESDQRYLYNQFGLNLGLAFQVQDDILGIWGDSQKTGKSADSDLVTGKKSLPILFALSQRKDFYFRWPNGKVPLQDVPEAIQVLNDEGAKEFSINHSIDLTEKALSSLDQAKPDGQAGQALKQLAYKLVNRPN
jgi:geranylgeranyl diphosphate synthase, type I